MNKKAIDQAVEILGSQGALGRALGLSRQRISIIVKSGKMPPKYCIPIEKATGGRVKRYELRPDIYPPEDYKQ